MSYAARLERLRRSLDAYRMRGLAVAFSGGVDSSVLLHAAYGRLGERAVAVLADSPSLPRRELEEARRTAADVGARLVVLATDELEREGYRANAGQRCYHCRRSLFERMGAWAAANDVATLAYGEITDDLYDVRPGRRAAAELAVVAPLRAAGLSKEDVRRYAREHGLRPAEKAASACLASRIPLGTEVTPERLGRIEQAEEALRPLRFRVLRVRDHGRRARVEVGADELVLAHTLRADIAARLAPCDFVEVELAAYGRGAAPEAEPAPARR